MFSIKMIFSNLFNKSNIKSSWWKILLLFFVGLFLFPLTITGLLSYGIGYIGRKNKKMLIVKIPVILFLLFLGASGTVAMYVDDKSTSSKRDQQVPVGKAGNLIENVENTKKVVSVETSPKEPSKQAVALYPVVKVIDGDTLSVDIEGKIEVLRLIGINTPETVDPRKTVECFGKEAGDKAKTLLTGQRVRLEGDPTQGELDKYDRLLRYVFLEDGRFFNDLMIREGYAYEYTYAIPYKYQDQFKQTETEARENKRGLFADDTCAGKLTAPTNPQNTQQKQDAETATPSVTSSIATCECESNKYNCTDFKTYAEAQAVYECCLGKVGVDVHRLDQDKDGKACESLP